LKSVIEKITKLLRSESDIQILKDFEFDGNYWISGRISIKYKGVELAFKTKIPANYPLSQPHTDNISINFINRDLIGCKYINNDGSVCFHPDKDDNFERKLKAEIVGLKSWINDYYINDKEAERYTYLMPPFFEKEITIFYFGFNKKKFKKGDFGSFSYSPFQSTTTDLSFIKPTKLLSYFRIGFEHFGNDDWSSDFTKSLTQKTSQVKLGLWCYVEDEPIKDLERKRLIVDSWLELQSFLPSKFKSILYKTLKEKQRKYINRDELFILIGYKIPTEENYETHWNLIKINLKRNPYKKRALVVDQDSKNFKFNQIVYGRTIKCSYDRFFGRGRLCKELTDSRILIIGIGAIGSCLAEILVRGGSKSLSLDDFDSVETGNLCRANYTLNDINLSKIRSLQQRLRSISPFVNIYSRDLKINLIPSNLIESEFNSHFDIIFDCSTDSEVSYLLGSLRLDCTVISLALTNNANYITSVINSSIPNESSILHDVLESNPASFFEGAGCGYPTFNASYNNVNTVLNCAISQIDQTYKSEQTLNSFYIKNLDLSSQINIHEYQVYFQNELEHTLFVPKNLITKIESNLIKQYPNEFGGVFIGIRSKMFHNMIIQDIIFPERYKNGSTEFIRYPKSVNNKLEFFYKESNGTTDYIGEFHSHPNGSLTPSQTDLNAMSDISNNSSINIQYPLLMIGQISKHEMSKLAFYIYNKNKLSIYEQKS